MNTYRSKLVMLTHGDDYSVPDRALRSFLKHVYPLPDEVAIIVDKPYVPSDLIDLVDIAIDGGPEFTIECTMGRKGFCGATKQAWVAGAEGEHDVTFYLEHDFEFLRPVNLAWLTMILATNLKIAQVSLMRQPINEKEIAAGGVVQSFPTAHFERSRIQGEMTAFPMELTPGGAIKMEKVDQTFLVHSVYLTTNPSLMRKDFMAANPWPDYPKTCEGRFGLDLISRGYQFAIMGEGEPWVNHFGERNGHGY